jgi:hypothetical protein
MVYPDLLDIARASWHPQIDTAISPGKSTVLRLTVHSRRFPLDLQELRYLVVEGMRRVRRLDRLEEVELIWSERRDVERRRVRSS